VEENVKATVKSIASDSVIKNIYKSLAANPANETAVERRGLRRRSGVETAQANVFIHGLVYGSFVVWFTRVLKVLTRGTQTYQPVPSPILECLWGLLG